MEAVVTKEGIEYFSLSSPIAITESMETVQILSAQEALEKALIPMENNITDETYTINDIYLEYVPLALQSMAVPDTLCPYWVICFQSDSGSVWSDAIRINAITGENLSYGK
jgi:hypothetical protein